METRTRVIQHGEQTELCAGCSEEMHYGQEVVEFPCTKEDREFYPMAVADWAVAHKRCRLEIEVERLIPSLDPIDQQIMTMRFGVGAYQGQPCNLQVTADALHIPRLEIRQREAKFWRGLQEKVFGTA